MSFGNWIIPIEEVPEENKLRTIMSRRFPNGMPEWCVAITLREILKGVDQIHTTHVGGGEPVVDSERIGIFWETIDHFPYDILIGYHDNHMHFQAGGDDPQRRQVGVWGAGIVALELAYGSLENIAPHQLAILADNVVRILRRKLNNDRKKNKKLPDTLQKLLRDRSFYPPEKELIHKKKGGLQKAVMKLADAFKFLPKGKPRQKKRTFSRDFLEVVLKCLDVEHPMPIDEIIELPFLRYVMPNDISYYECVLL